MTVLLLTATAAEQAEVAARLDDPVLRRRHGRDQRHGRLTGVPVRLVETGIGLVNTAQALTSNISGAKESVTQALSDAETTIDAGDRAGRLVMIVPAQIAVGDIIGAKMSISQALANPQYNPTAISEVALFALARAAVGDFNGAGELMNQALASLVTGEEVISHDTIGIAFIASAQAALGDI